MPRRRYHVAADAPIGDRISAPPVRPAPRTPAASARRLDPPPAGEGSPEPRLYRPANEANLLGAGRQRRCQASNVKAAAVVPPVGMSTPQNPATPLYNAADWS